MVAPVVLAALISAAASIGSSMLADKGGHETGIQKQKRSVIDQILAGLGGQGDFANLFDADPEAFKKSFADPAMAQFQNRTAPGIQQQFISSGLQRGTGLDDSLTRAGVDMQSMLNSEYMKFLQGSMDRKSNAINAILGADKGASDPMSTADQAKQGAAGYLSSDSFSSSVDKILQEYMDKPGADTSRPGFENTK